MTTKTSVFKKTVNLGLVEKHGPLEVTCEITRHERLSTDQPWSTIDLETIRSYHEVSITAYLWNKLKTDIVTGGQMQEGILEYVDTPFTRNLVEVWREFHNNDMNAGTRKQQACFARFPDLSTMEARLNLAAMLFALPDDRYKVVKTDRKDPRQALHFGSKAKIEKENALLDKIEAFKQLRLDALWLEVIPTMHKLRDSTKPVDRNDYTLLQLWLLANNLLWDQGYGYGSAWLVNPINQHDLDMIMKLFNDEPSQPEPQTLVDKVKIVKCKHTGQRDKMWRYDVTLEYDGHQETFDCGYGNPSRSPTEVDVIGMLQMDLQTDNDPDYLASEFGYKPSEAMRISKALKKNREKLERLFEDDIDQLMEN